MISIKPGDAIVIEHPFMMNRHIVAVVAAVMPKMCYVRYVSPRAGDEGEAQKRSRTSIVGALPEGTDLRATAIRLRKIGDKLQEAENQARAQYRVDVAAVVAGEPE